MKVLFIGGTGVISAACTREALSRGIQVTHLNRGNRPERVPEGVTSLKADIRNRQEVVRALAGSVYDCIVDWVAFTPDHVLQDIEMFRDMTDHYVFISSASAYLKPPPHWLVTEETPLGNPYWQYSRDKIACEEVLREACQSKKFPATIVRPSHTYSDGWIPTPIGSRDFTIAQRMLDDRPVISPGDGQSVWTITHSDDFARGFIGLLGRPEGVGEAFHITSDEARTWDIWYGVLASALGVELNLAHIPSEFVNEVSPALGQGLLGDKAYSMVFDNTKIRRIVPDFKASIPFEEGIRRSLKWFDEAPGRKTVDEKKNQEIEKVIRAWERKQAV